MSIFEKLPSATRPPHQLVTWDGGFVHASPVCDERWPAFEIAERGTEAWLIPCMLLTGPNGNEDLAWTVLATLPAGLENGEGPTEWWEMEYDSSPLEQALRLGVAPFQPFYIRLDREVFGGSYYEPDDIDIEYHVELVWKEPWTQRRVRLAWEEALEQEERMRAQEADHRDAWDIRCAEAPAYLAIGWHTRPDPHWRIERRTLAEPPCECCHHHRVLDTLTIPSALIHGLAPYEPVFDQIRAMGWDDLPMRPYSSRAGERMLEELSRAVLPRGDDEDPSLWDVPVDALAFPDTRGDLPPLADIPDELVLADARYRLDAE